MPPVTVDQALASPAAAEQMVDDYVAREAEFFDRARNPQTQITFDGVDTDPATGAATKARPWSAASKESLDLGILTKAIEHDPIAVKLVGRGDVAAATQRALKIMEGKLDSYEAFQKEQPGFGGWLPWFYSDRLIDPTPAWHDQVPGLDNGEWAWSMLTAEHTLRAGGHTQLADRYKAYVDRLRENVVDVFYDAQVGKIRAASRVSDASNPIAEYSTGSPPGVGEAGAYLTGEHGVHEGQMMVLFTTLFGKGLPADASKRLWDGIKMTRVEHQHGTTWQAFWGSPHESWQYLFLPYRDLPEFEQLFRIREAIRSNNANDRGYPGLATSTNRPGGGSYLSDAGIEDIGTQPVSGQNTFAVYGAFPMLLEAAGRGTTAAGNAGLGWLVNMLHAPRQYGPMAGGESGSNDGKLAADMKTIDGSFPNLLAMMGGVTRETADMLRSYGVYDEFTKIMRNEFQETFGAAPLREPSKIAPPTTRF